MMDDWSRHKRELCHGCLELFCRKCAIEHGLFSESRPQCDRTGDDYRDLSPAQDVRIPGWKAAFVEKQVPGALCVYYEYSGMERVMGFCVNMQEHESATIGQWAMEELYEGLGFEDWWVYPVSSGFVSETVYIPDAAKGGFIVMMGGV